MSNLSDWFIADGFMPHGQCFAWDPFLLRQSVLSNALIGISYYCIPLALVYFVRKRKDLEFNWIFLMFSAFIFACGTTHFMGIVTIWRPAYRLDADLMSITAIVSVATLISLIKLMPRLLLIPSPSTLKATIGKLQQQVERRIEAESALRRLNAELDEKVAQRTRELTAVNQQLAAAKAVLEQKIIETSQVNQELNQFTYIASHDLKSPLRGIDQLATWIAEDLGDDLSDDSRKHVSLMRSRIKRLERLLDDLLTYAKAGRSDDPIVPVDSRELIENIFDLTAPHDGMRLIIGPDMPILRTKKVPLELVLRNLIGNAIKHNDKSHGTIAVSAVKTPAGYEFEVRDDGPGIAPEHHARVFAMFQTLRPRDDVEGSGIGLALVKKAVEAMGGSITLESDGQRGCSFRFTWPNVGGPAEPA